MAHKAAGLLGKLVAGHNANSNKRPTKAALQAQRRRAVKLARLGCHAELGTLATRLKDMAQPTVIQRGGFYPDRHWQPTAEQLLVLCQLGAVQEALSLQAVMAVADGKPVDIDLATAAATGRAEAALEFGWTAGKAHSLSTALVAQRLQAVKSAAHKALRALSDLDSAIDQMAYADGSTARKDWQPTAAQWLLLHQLDAIRHSLSIKALLAVADGKPVDIDMAAAVGKARHKQARRVDAVAAAAARS